MPMTSDPVKYPSLIQWVKATAMGRAPSACSREEAARNQALRRRLGELVRHVDVKDREAVDRVRMPFLRQVALSEWGESALSDHVAAALLRAVDRLIAADHGLHGLMCQVIEVLGHASGTEGCMHDMSARRDKSENS